MIVSPSILSADFSNLLKDVIDVKEKGAQYIHVDVMDGHFVPNITMGAVVLESLKGKCDIVKDVHLMIDNPLKYAESFKKAGADIITFHYDSVVTKSVDPYSVVAGNPAKLIRNRKDSVQ